MQKIKYTSVKDLRVHPNNPRLIKDHEFKILCESVKNNPDYFETRPILCNKQGIIFAGNQRYLAAKQIGMKEVPVCVMDISEERQKEIMLRDNRQNGEWNWDILKDFGEEFLSEIGFSSEELDNIFAIEDVPEKFDLEKELKSLDIKKIEIKEGDVWQIGDNRLMCGSSLNEEDVLTLMGNEKADMCFTDPPYILDYLKGKKKKNGKVTEGFGLKRDRIYLGTESLPDNFSGLWMTNIAKVQKPNFSIIIFENPKNLRTIWNALEAHWKYRNTIIWHIPNRVQGFSAKYKLFNKHDFAIVGNSGEIALNTEPEKDELLQSEYETALFATSGSPHWESYGKGKKYCPTDFIEYKAADKKSSGQGIIFGTKPTEILIPYIKVMTKRGDLIVEPFCGSGSTGAAAIKMHRRCYLMEKSNVYATVALRRLEKLTGCKATKINERTTKENS